MLRLPRKFTRRDTRFPYATLFRSPETIAARGEIRRLRNDELDRRAAGRNVTLEIFGIHQGQPVRRHNRHINLPERSGGRYRDDRGPARRRRSRGRSSLYRSSKMDTRNAHRRAHASPARSEAHTSELTSLMRTPYGAFRLKTTHVHNPLT